MPTIQTKRLNTITEKEVLQLQQNFPDNNWDLNHCRQFVADNNNYLLVAVTDTVICGFLTAYTLPRLDNLNPEVFLYEIEVNSNYRKQGIGTQLIQKLTEHAKEIQAKEIFVLTNVSNIPAVKLYESTGGIKENPDDVMFVYPLGITKP
jgi:ribosomal protein S18 acetylase RimI-like enzyme